MANTVDTADLVVVGAGFAGLSAAKTYLQCEPSTKLIVVDNHATIGGVWSKERIYPSLHSNNQLGTLELPDFPMNESYGVKPGEHIPGMALHKYLNDFSNHYDITKDIRLNSQVTVAEKLADGSWLLDVTRAKTSSDAASTYQIKCAKLIVATGLTSQAEPVSYPNQAAFGAPILNSLSLAQEGLKIALSTPAADKEIVVLGGSKSAYDSVYQFASNGFKVHWVIRKTGYGPTWLAPGHIQVGPARLRTETLPCVRAMSWFSPCLWATDAPWIRWFLHGTAFGRFLVHAFWNKFGAEVVAQTKLNEGPELAKLIPDQSALWYATSLAILNYDSDIHDFVRSGQVSVHRADVARLGHQTVHLADGTALRAAAGLMTATAWEWRPNVEFRPASLHADLGIPSAQYSPEQKAFWHALDAQADREILEKYPILRAAPGHGYKEAAQADGKDVRDAPAAPSKVDGLEPYRLYRFLAPPGLTAKGDRSVVFAGFTANLLNMVRNDLAGLWAYAYLNDKLEIDPATVQRRAAMDMRFCKRRYPFGWGSKFPDFVFEQIPFFDRLLEDLGLQHRRKQSLFKEIFSPYKQEDYRGVTAEWLAMNRKA